MNIITRRAGPGPRVCYFYQQKTAMASSEDKSLDIFGKPLEITGRV